MDKSIKADKYKNEKSDQGDKRISKALLFHSLGPIPPDTGKDEKSGEYNGKADNWVAEKKDIFFDEKQFDKHETRAY